MSDNHVYRPPKADLETPRQVVLQEPRGCPPSAGVYWIQDAWRLFRLNPFFWISMWAVFFLSMVVLSILPIVSVFMTVLTPVFTAGFVFAAAKLEQGKTVGIEDLFVGFSRNLGALLGIGGLSFIFSALSLTVAVLITFLFFVDATTIKELLSGQVNEELIRGYLTEEQLFLVLLVGLIYLVLQVPLLMLTWFAPVLIIQHDIGVWQAMILSFFGCLRNVFPLLLFGLVFMGLFIIAIIPMFLGLIVVSPLFMLAFYTTYKDIFLHTEQYETSLIA
jgi:uncharacterized membrane protein